MTFLPLELPLDPDADEARAWLAEELGTGNYGHNWGDDLWRWIEDLLDGQLRTGSVSFGSAIVVAVVALLVAGIAWWAWRARGATRAKVADDAGAVLPDQRLSAEQYRAEAQRALLAGDTDAALIASFRAMAVDLVRRTVLGDQPGRTAQELAAGIATHFPRESQALHQAAQWFDGAAYGVAPSPRVTRDQAAQVMALDDRVAATRPDWLPERQR